MYLIKMCSLFHCYSIAIIKSQRLFDPRRNNKDVIILTSFSECLQMYICLWHLVSGIDRGFFCLHNAIFEVIGHVEIITNPARDARKILNSAPFVRSLKGTPLTFKGTAVTTDAFYVDK